MKIIDSNSRVHRMGNVLSALICSISLICVLSFFVSVLNGCGKNYSSEGKKYIAKIEQERKEQNDWMKNNPSSPFNFKGKVEFHDLNYFDINPDFIFKSKLYEFSSKDTIIIYGTKGEPRKTVRYGYIIITYEKIDYKVNVYQNDGRDRNKYYSIWITDKTTNKETYGVGRYLNFDLIPDTNYIYTIDFNLLYNPYCAYSSNYSCAIPTRDDFLPIEILAGEKKFHN